MFESKKAKPYTILLNQNLKPYETPNLEPFLWSTFLFCTLKCQYSKIKNLKNDLKTNEHFLHITTVFEYTPVEVKKKSRATIHISLAMQNNDLDFAMMVNHIGIS